MHEQVSETTVPQLLTMLPGWARTTVRDGLDDLIDLGLVASPSMGRGRRERVYAVLPDAVATTTAVPAIRLRDLAPLPDLATDTAEMAELAGNGGTPSANISPALTTGCSEMAEMAAEMLPSQDSAPDRNRLPFPSPPNRTRVLPQQHQGEIAHAG